MTINSPQISVKPNPVRMDEPVEILIYGAPAGTSIILKAAMREITGSDWESYAEFLTDQFGNVVVKEHVPISGTNACKDPMGLIWSMEWTRNDPTMRTPMAPIKTGLTLIVDGEEVASGHPCTEHPGHRTGRIRRRQDVAILRVRGSYHATVSGS